MNKENYREYFENIFKYLNVKSICKMYNEKNIKYKINYCNLKSFVNQKQYSKISIKRLELLTYYIKQTIGVEMILEENKESHVIKRSQKKLKKELIEVIKKYEGEKNEI